MSKTILVCGFGPGISTALANKFGGEGFSVALVARTSEHLAAGVEALTKNGVRAVAIQADLSDPSAAASLVERARAALGPISVVFWNAYSGLAGDLLSADAAAIRGALDVAVTGLVATVQAALTDLRKAEAPAILVTNGGFGRIDANVDAVCTQLSAMGLGLANAAKNKLVGLLAAKLAGEGIYVGQLMVLGTVRGTAFDNGSATLEPRAIAERFWSLYTARSELRADFS